MGGLNCQYSTNNYGHTYLIQNMAEAVLYNKEPMITGTDAMESVKVILDIYESSNQKVK